MTPVHAGVHIRENLSILARSEKRALIWIAERLPASVNSDHLSALGLAAMAGAGLSFAAFPVAPWAAAAGVVAFLALNWFGDSLDGTVARVRQQQRPRYGFYVDHIIDVAGSALLFGGMACSQLMSPVVALALLAAYLLVSAESYLATHAAGTFRMSFLGFGPTELRIVLAVGALRAAISPWATLGDARVLLYDVGGIVACSGMLVAFVVASIRNTRALSMSDPRPEGGGLSRVA